MELFNIIKMKNINNISMKSLQEFIIENVEVDESKSESKTITFNFDGLENGEDTLKSLEDKEGCLVEDNKLTINLSEETKGKLDSVQDILQQYCETIRNSSKRSSDEQYAQKTKSFADKLNEFNTALDELENPDEDDDKDDKKEDE